MLRRGFSEPDTFGVPDPEHTEGLDAHVEQAISDFKSNQATQAIYNAYSESLDELLKRTMGAFNYDLDRVDAFLADLSAKLLEAEADGQDISDVIENSQP